ncbi:MAG: hypothetical protein WA160_03570 [Pseudobdellovibrio sp.]
MSNYSRFLTATVICSQLLLSLFFFTNCASTQKAELKNYVSLDIAYPYYKMILGKLENRLGKSLKSRGESHVTLITPPEFNVLKTKISPEQIHKMAAVFFETKPEFKSVCLGKFEKKILSEPQQVYFVVIESKDFLEFRKSLALQSGLDKNTFDPDLFYPHVTIGFSERDLHYEDGAIKNATACPADLKAILKER